MGDWQQGTALDLQKQSFRECGALGIKRESGYLDKTGARPSRRWVRGQNGMLRPAFTLCLGSYRYFWGCPRKPSFKLGKLVSMLHHRALGRDLEQLVVCVVDNNRPMLSMMRAMLAAIGAGRIQTHEDAAEAFEAMAEDTPDLVIAAASMNPVTGPELISAMRQADAGPLCFVPAMITSAHAKPGLVDALRAGAHQVLMLPISASTLHRRLDWLLNDDRPFDMHDGHYVVAGMEERLALSVPQPAYAATPKAPPLVIGQQRPPATGTYG